MTIAAAVLDAMIAGGCTREQIVAAIKADAQVDEDRLAAKRAKDAERQRKHRSGHAMSRPSRNVTVTKRDKGDPPQENKSTPPVPPSSTDVDDHPPSIESRFVETWNGERGLRPALKLAGDRLKKFRLRLKAFGEPALVEAVHRLGASPFHCGNNDRGWQATIGWLIKSDENVTKALELDPVKGTGPLSLDDAAATADRAAALYRRMGRDDDAREADARAAALRSRASGPPRPIGELIRSTAQAAMDLAP